MTNEEAIKALRLEGGLEISGNARRLAQFMEALSVAIDALRRVSVHIDREAWEACGDCKSCENCIHALEEVHEYPCIECIAAKKYDEKPYLHFVPNGFCQFCGRPLTPKAWAELEKRIGGAI